jgi:hypothetical protein
VSVASRGLTPAVGGVRMIPKPDAIGRDYIVLCLRIDQHVAGFVDAYFGPADLKAKVELEQVRPVARLQEDVAALRERIGAESDDPERRRWFTAQLVAIDVQLQALVGDPLPYVDHVAACFDYRMTRRPDSVYRAAATHLAELLPGDGPLLDRLAAWDALFFVPPAQLGAVIDRVIAVVRERSEQHFGLPPGEGLRVALVTGEPWSAYNWYDGGFQSRIDVNTDLPIAAKRLVDVLAHEAYPGHHLENVWKESDLVGVRGRLEATVLTYNTPECLISEGLAELGLRFASPPESEAELLAELFGLAGLPLARDPIAAADAAERTVAMAGARGILAAASADAALLRHADGVSHDDVLAYLRDVGLMAPDRAAKLLEFIEHPLYRTYVFVYSEGERLLGRWLDAVPPASRAARFGRLLHEQLTPGAIVDELAPASQGPRGQAATPRGPTASSP